MRRPVLAVATAATGALLLAGCGVERGVVLSKGYDEAYDYVSMQCMPMGNNACGMQIPITNYVPECWRLDLQDGDDQGSVCVEQDVFDRLTVGQRYDPPPS